MWLPYSPDINPMDFTNWSVMEEDIRRTNYNNLNRTLRVIWSKLEETNKCGAAANQ